MSISAKDWRRGLLAFVLVILVSVIAAWLVPTDSDATRPVIPADPDAPVCPATGPELRVKAPAKPVRAPATVRIAARVGSPAERGCFDLPMRLCVRTGDRAERDLRVRRRCVRRGVGSTPLLKKAAFMIRVTRRAEGTYRIVLRAHPIRPSVSYRSFLNPRVTTELKVLGR